MTDIINFMAYVSAKDEEKKRIKMVSMLSAKSKDVEGLLHNINSSIGCSLVTRHFGEMNQIVGMDNTIDSDILNVIIESLKDYDNKIHEQINKLNSYGTQASITC